MSNQQFNDPTRNWYITAENISTSTTGSNLTLDASANINLFSGTGPTGSIYFNNFDIAGNSNYAFPLILRDTSIKLRDNLERLMKDNKIEFRRGNAGGGNQLRQPYLNDYLKKYNLKDFPNVEHVHFFGYYIGNYPSLKKVKILKIISILNSLK